MQVVSKMAHSHVVTKYYPIAYDMLLPVALTFGAWAILPKLLRRTHDFVEDGQETLLHAGKKPDQRVPYDLSIFSALEEPCRLFATFLFLSQLGAIVAPTTFASTYLKSIWNGGSVATLIWFLQRWKRNVLTRFLKDKQTSHNERERYLALDQISTIILLFVGALGLAEASGVAVQSLLTVGGIGGVATAFAARDVLGNLLSGLSLVFSKPFSTGDVIKAGNVEGTVEEVGLHSTRLLNTDKNPVVVPNSFFSSEVIINKSRAEWRALAMKIPLRLQDVDKLGQITRETRNYLSSNKNVYMGEDKPRCCVTNIGPMGIDLVLKCNVNLMSNEEFHLLEEEILMETAKIVKGAGANLGA